MLLFILLLLGIFTGILAGLFGLGGGILFTPILFTIFQEQGVQNPTAWAIGTSLFCNFIAAGSSSFQQFKKQNMFWRQGVIVGLFGIAGVFVGKEIVLSPFYTETVFILFFCLLLVLTAISYFRRGKSIDRQAINTRPVGIGSGSVTGGTAGIVAATAGLGGGIVMVPIMNLFYKMSIGRSVSISSFAIVIISFAGWLQYALVQPPIASINSYTIGYVDFGSALPLVLGAVAGGIIGVNINHKINRTLLQYGFSFTVIIVALYMLIRLFN
ncbi:MAG: sulfite exporter TauE/SafE family protein [Balneolaceae bacterium]